MKKSMKNLLLYGLVMLLVLALTGVAWAVPADTTSSEQKSSEPQTASVFKDVQAGDSNLIYINYLAKREIISGFPDGGFHPNEGLSRAQAATLLAKAAGLSSSDKKAVFKDVNDGHWAAGSITAAANAGYLKGYPDGNYHPEEKLTRAQGISLVLRLSKQKDTGIELPALKDLDSKHWAARSAAIGLAAGMVGLSSDKTQFLPDTVFSRGDLSRALAVLLTTDPDLSQVALNGSLEVKKGDVKVNDKAVSGTVSIKTGDSIATGVGAEAQLNYPDGSGLLIKENSQLAVKETKGRSYIKQDGSPGTAVDWLLVDLKKGDVFGALATNPNIKEETSEKKTAGLGEKLLAGISGALEYLAAEPKEAPWYKTAEAKKVKVKVDMPYGVAAIRGSFWNNMVTSTGCSTSALEGDVATGALGGETVPVPAGQSSSVNQGGAAPTPPAPMTPAQALGWTQQANWLQNIIQSIQANQEAIRTEAVITQVLQNPVPGQPTTQPPVAPLPPAPAVPDIMNIVNQALTQVQQNAGLPAQGLGSQLPGGYNLPGTGGGGQTQEYDSGSSPASVLASLLNSPAYLQVNSITVSGSSLSLSGKTYPGNSVRICGILLQNSPSGFPIATADSYGNFSFSNISINSSLTDAFLVVDQLLDSTGAAGTKASLLIPNVLNSPALPAMLKINRGKYTDASTPVLITGQVLPAQGHTVTINKVGDTASWSGTTVNNGEFSIDIGVQSPGTQLGASIMPAPNTTAVSGGGHTYVYTANAVGVMATMPMDTSSVPAALGTVQVFFDRSVAAGSNFESISISQSGGSPLGITPTISGSILSFNTADSLAAYSTYTVNIPAGAIQDTGNPNTTNPAFSFSFCTAGSSGAQLIQNPYLQANIMSDGPFSLGTVDGSALTSDNNKNLLFGWPDGATSITTIRLGDEGTYTDNTFGQGGTWVQTPANSSDGLSNSSQYSYNQNIIVRQDLALVNDKMEISYTLTNNDTVAHTAGLRIMLDTKVGDNDEALFRVNGTDVTTRTAYDGAAIPASWLSLDSLSSPGTIALGDNALEQANVPNRFVISSYGHLTGNLWDDTYTGTLGDSAVALYWNPSSIAAGASKVFVMRYGVTDQTQTPGSWSQVGTTITDVSSASGLGLVGGAEPFVAYRDSSNFVNVNTLTGGGATWNPVGTSLCSSQGLLDLSLQASGPVVAYVNSSGTLAVSSYVYDTCTWANLIGGAALPSSGIDYLALDVPPAGQQKPYLAYRSGNSVQTYVYEAAGWVYLDSSSVAGTVSNDTGERLCLNASTGYPYLAFRNEDRMPTVIKYDGCSWIEPDYSNLSSASSLALAVDGCTPYIAFRDGDETDPDAQGKVMAYMYTTDTFEWTDNQWGYFSAGPANHIDLAVGNNVPFVAYSDGNQGGKLTVKYNCNNQWVALGTEGFSAEAVTETRIRIFNGSVYVMYKDSSGEIAVMKHSLPALNLP